MRKVLASFVAAILLVGSGCSVGEEGASGSEAAIEPGKAAAELGAFKLLGRYKVSAGQASLGIGEWHVYTSLANQAIALATSESDASVVAYGVLVDLNAHDNPLTFLQYEPDGQRTKLEPSQRVDALAAELKKLRTEIDSAYKTQQYQQAVCAEDVATLLGAVGVVLMTRGAIRWNAQPQFTWNEALKIYKQVIPEIDGTRVALGVVGGGTAYVELVRKILGLTRIRCWTIPR